MKHEPKPERIFYEKHGIRIAQGDLNWTVATIRKSGERSKVQGEDRVGNVTYHPTLASACGEAALRIADAGEKASLRAYWSDLTDAILELKASFPEVYQNTNVVAVAPRHAIAGTKR
jgi:hypothetical protein